MKTLAAIFLTSLAFPTLLTAKRLPFECDFESDTWFEAWGLGGGTRNTEVVEEDADRKFEPHRGKALRIKIGNNSHYGTSLEYRFKDMHDKEPEEIYFRYYLRLADDWRPGAGGKFPGFGGTYGQAGWGGRPVTGSDGWSARGLFERRKDGKTPVGFYCYHVDMKGKYGSNWHWDIGLENNRWYCVEQYCKMNTPEKNDGILRAWVDGKQVFEKKDVRMRNTNKLKIETVWFNIYHGGSKKARRDHHLYIDDVAISKERVGPVKKGI